MPLILLGAHFAEHDRIHDFKVRWVCRQRHMHLIAVELAVAGNAQVIFDVAGAFHVLRICRAALEFMEERAEGLSHHICENVQPPAMGHAEHDFLHAELAAALDDLLERRDVDSPPSSPKRLVPVYFLSRNFSKPSVWMSFAEDGFFAKLGKLYLFIGSLDALLNPRLLLGR